MTASSGRPARGAAEPEPPRSPARRRERRPSSPPAAAAVESEALPAIGEIGLDQFAPYLLNRVSAQWNAALAALLGHLGLGTTRFRALAVLTVASGITVSELALFAVTEQSTMSRTLDTLEAQGLIRRHAKTGDMRVREVFITEQGLALFARIWPDVYRLHARFFAGVDEAEFRGFVATLHKVMRNGRPADAPPVDHPGGGDFARFRTPRG